MHGQGGGLTVALLLLAIGVLLIASATPRQAGVASPSRVRVSRLAGWSFLVVSLGMMLGNVDAARNFVAWVCAAGVIALLVALGFTARRKDR
jgi:cell division protein FtsW (lipid II flippase)